LNYVTEFAYANGIDLIRQRAAVLAAAHGPRSRKQLMSATANVSASSPLAKSLLEELTAIVKHLGVRLGFCFSTLGKTKNQV
jgi:hypothetical protein